MKNFDRKFTLCTTQHDSREARSRKDVAFISGQTLENEPLTEQAHKYNVLQSGRVARRSVLLRNEEYTAIQEAPGDGYFEILSNVE